MCKGLLNINFFDENIKKQIHDEIRKLEEAEWESNKKPIKGTWYIQKYFDKSNLTIQEIASLISTISLESVERNKKTEHFAENFKEFISFERYIEQAINEDKLKFNFSHCIDNDKKLHSFLFNDGHIIKGYNDYLAIEPAEPVSQIVFTDSQLSQQVADLNAQLTKAGDTINRQAKELTDLKTQIEEVTKQKDLIDSLYNISKILLEGEKKKIQGLTEKLASIEHVGKGTQSDKPADNELLTAIYDDSKPYLYAPELHNAIEVWKLIYHDNLTSQHLTTHSDKFESAIKQLGIAFANNAPKNRLKQITTPQQQKEKTKSKNS